MTGQEEGRLQRAWTEAARIMRACEHGTLSDTLHEDHVIRMLE